MAETKSSTPKRALDKYGGDPLAPNDAVLERIAKVAKGGKEDDLVERWADAFSEACPEPNTPKRILLGNIAKVVSGKKVDEPTEAAVKDWAGGGEKKKQAARSDHNLDHLP
jgi:hypothetical protein